MLDALEACELASQVKPGYVELAEKVLAEVLASIREAALHGGTEYERDLAKEIRGFYPPGYQYWYSTHDPFRIHLTKLLRSLHYKVSHKVDYSLPFAPWKVMLRVKWGNKAPSKDPSSLCCGGCNRTFCTPCERKPVDLFSPTM
jgi:hypothetical protein